MCGFVLLLRHCWRTATSTSGMLRWHQAIVSVLTTLFEVQSGILQRKMVISKETGGGTLGGILLRFVYFWILPLGRRTTRHVEFVLAMGARPVHEFWGRARGFVVPICARTRPGSAHLSSVSAFGAQKMSLLSLSFSCPWLPCSSLCIAV